MSYRKYRSALRRSLLKYLGRRNGRRMARFYRVPRSRHFFK